MFHGANARHSARMVNDRFPDGAMVSNWYRDEISENAGLINEKFTSKSNRKRDSPNCIEFDATDSPRIY
jgi:hypothetical protein